MTDPTGWSPLSDRLAAPAAPSAPSPVRSDCGCALCRVRDALDLQATARWLATRRTRRGGLLGVACCPLHAWRLRACCTAAADQDAMDLLQVRPPESQETARWHVAAALTFERALATGVRDATLLSRRLGMPDVLGLLVSLTGDLPPGLLSMEPRCPLCARSAQMRSRALEVFTDRCAAATPAQRQALAHSLCPSDRRLCAPLVEHFTEFEPPPSEPASRAEIRWWDVPGYGQRSRALVERLIYAPEELPDGVCPACWVRAQQERALVAVLARAPATDLSATHRIALGQEEWEFPEPVAWNMREFCSRHFMLVRAAAAGESPGSYGEATAVQGHALPLVWPTGTLRAAPEERTCQVCMALCGWDAIRLWGLQRASGSALLFEEVTLRLRAALEQRRFALCLTLQRRCWTGRPGPYASNTTRCTPISGMRMKCAPWMTR
jgi:hypothetical protein